MAKRKVTQKATTEQIEEVELEVARRAVKNLRISVYPPDGRVRVVVPLQAGEAFWRSAVQAKLNWIRQKQRLLAHGRTDSPLPRYCTGETHYFLGHPYCLQVQAHKGPAQVCVRNERVLDFFIRESWADAQREKAFLDWYRAQLRVLVPVLLDKWQPVLGVSAREWGIKRMKTRWGTCNVTARRIWINLELAKKPFACLEYIVVHELVHLLERSHNARFWGLMDRFLPEWRKSKQLLNQKQGVRPQPNN